MRYTVKAFQNGQIVCEVGLLGELDSQAAVHFARDLRKEFPGAVVAMLPYR